MNYENLISNKGKYFKGPLIVSPNVHRDTRGYFFESWNINTFSNIVGEKIEFVQDNQSKSYIGVLRGLHYQLPPMGQGKLVRVTKGLIYDVIVDLRRESATFAQWGGIKLSEESNNQLWIPIGFAHGFLTLSKYAIVEYKVTEFWSAKEEKSLIWDDKDIEIKWPDIKDNQKNPILSIKDQSADKLSKLIESNELF
tara:strand:+ start:294 stop:881 length:588 start_codon:yes stop_codon:yes gene_type:complete